MEDVAQVRYKESDLLDRLGLGGCSGGFGGCWGRRRLYVGSELGVQPVSGIGSRHGPVGNVVGFVEMLFCGLRGRFHLAVGNVHDQVDAALGSLNRGKTHGELERAVGVVDLFHLDFVEVHAGDDLGQGLAVVHLAAAGLDQGSHGADGLAGGFGVDQVNFGVGGHEVGDDLLGLIGAFAHVQAAEVSGGGVNRQDTLDPGVGASGLDFGVVRPAQLNHHDRLVWVGGFPLLGHLGAHGERNALLIAAGGGDAGVGQRAEEGGHHNALVEGGLHTGLGGFGVPDV